MAGSSNRSGKLQILEWFTSNQSSIKSIVDIGAGRGTYIKLIKEENNICVNTNWTAIEAWPTYIQNFKLKERYNRVIHQDVRSVDWGQFNNLDVTIAGDVLEHMSKEDAILLVDKVLSKSKYLIISIPIVHFPQDEIEGNPFEIHVKDDWSHEEILDTWGHYIFNSFRKGTKSKIGVYWLKK